MSKFKIGDKVRVVKGGGAFPKRLLNAEGVISNQTPDDLWFIIYKGENRDWCANESQMELAEPPLKTGDIVNYIGKDVQVKAGNPWLVYNVLYSENRAVLKQPDDSGLISDYPVHRVSTKNLIKVQQEKKNPKYSVEQNVFHKDYGYGKVESIYNDNENVTYGIQFCGGYVYCCEKTLSIGESTIEVLVRDGVKFNRGEAVCIDNDGFAVKATKSPVDLINNPPHYKSHPSGIEPIAITEHMDFCLGNVIKYVMRADYKGNKIEDLEKAQYYLNRKIKLLKGEQK